MRFGRFRTVAFDGCASVKVPDTRPNRAWLGKLKAKLGVTGYPAIELMTLVETGTRALIGAVFGPRAPGETAYARQLLHLLGPDMLVLTDRGFDAAGFLEAVAATKAQFLARLTSTRLLPVMARLDDGTFVSRIGALTVRVIEAEVLVTCADGTRYCGRYRLATTLLEHRRYPAAALIRLYHERWEHEVAYLALRHTLLQGRVLRSKDPAGLEQEIWALLTLYQALRREMVTAAETVPGTDPDRASFTIALQTAIDTVTAADGVITSGTLEPGRIGRSVLDGLLPPLPAPGSASARSNPRSPAGTKPTRTAPRTAPRSPRSASRSSTPRNSNPRHAGQTLDRHTRPLTTRHCPLPGPSPYPAASWPTTRAASTMSPDQPQAPQKQTNTRRRAGSRGGGVSIAWWPVDVPPSPSSALCRR